MKPAALSLLLLLSLAAAPAALAQAIESEPLPPIGGSGSGSAADSSAASPGAIPMTTPSGAPVSLGGPPPAGASGSGAPVTSGQDNGMSGGGGSVYDMGVTPSPERSASPAPYGRDDTDASPASAPRTAPPAGNDEPYAASGGMAPAPTIQYGSSIGSAPPEKMPPATRKFCTLEIAFGNRGAGTDVVTENRIRQYLDSNRDKLTYLRADGARGGFSFCVDVEQHRNRAKIYKDLRALMPRGAQRDGAGGDTTLSGSGFETVTTRK